jgi:hypothetical protein
MSVVPPPMCYAYRSAGRWHGGLNVCKPPNLRNQLIEFIVSHHTCLASELPAMDSKSYF